MYRSQMSPQERSFRSRLKPLVSYQEFLKGSLTLRKQRCGKPNCKCATTRYRHLCLYLTRYKDGQVEQLFIPRDEEPVVSRWVRNYRDAQELMEKISSLYWDKLKRKG